MENNDVLRRFRYALKIPDTTMINIFKIAECQIDQPQLLNLLKKNEEPGYVACSTDLLERFFDGLILYNRGKQESRDEQEDYHDRDKQNQAYFQKAKGSLPREATERVAPQDALDNNVILKKLRIALDLKQEEMVEIFRLGELNITKGEFTALFRKKEHKNYKECGDQYLKKFFNGLAVRHRM
ncbi:MAG: DUF1456 family protein [Desulfamplus sp.]|nr:DUF1456 family protein [Desulfamplus sp.]